MLRAFRNFLFQCMVLLTLFVLLYPKINQFTGNVDSKLRQIGRPAGINLNLNDFLLNPGKAETHILKELINSLDKL